MIFAHYPPVFLRDAPGKGTEYRGYYHPDTEIAWDVYDDFEYCVPDFERGIDTDLVPLWMCDELNGNPKEEQNAGRSGGSGPPEPYQSHWFPKDTDYVEVVREDFRFADSSEFALLRRNSFICGVPYDTVAELIKVSISRRPSDDLCKAE